MRSNEIISSIVTLFNKNFQERGLYFKMSSGGESYYMVAKRKNRKPVQIRISNHGTYVKTWTDLVNKADSNVRLVDPSISINFSIVFIDNGDSLTYDCDDNQNCNDCNIPQCVPQQVKGTTAKKHTYQVMQYVYDSSVIRMKYIQGFVNMLYQAVRLGKFNDPLQNAIKQQGEQPPIERKAKPKQLKSVFIKEALIRSIVRKALLDMAFTYSINETNTRKDMKQNRIKITESQLRNMITEVISGLDWKTLQNAADKAFVKGDKRYEKFLNAAKDTFIDKYGDENSVAYIDRNNPSTFHPVQNLPKGDVQYQDISSMDKKGNMSGYGGWRGSTGADAYYTRPSSFMKNKFPKDTDTFEKMDSEYKKHVGDRNVWNRDSKYEYDNEKGWHLKESQLKNLIRKAVREALYR
ncbi:MAG: hypothetical protein MJY97_04880 [Bacteroidales bacterium]|nr:hypothetical protein [Bacteroidales bacterium]